MSDTPATPDPIDSLIALRLPKWLVDHTQPHRLDGLRMALRRQAHCHARLAPILQAITPLPAYAAGLLEEKLRRLGITRPDVVGSKVRMSERVFLPSASPALMLPHYLRHSYRSLLQAALHNYHRAETRPGQFRTGELVDRHGNQLPLSFHAFASACRAVDVGGQYQAFLKQHLQPEDGPEDQAGQATKRLHALLEQSFRANFDVAMRIAALKGDIDERAYLLMLPEVADKPVVPAVTGQVTPRQLYLLGRPVQGVLTFEVRAAADTPLQSVLLWVPGDPRTPVTRHDGWDSLGHYLGGRFGEPAYRRFFARFINERDRIDFYRLLNTRLTQAQAGVVELDARNTAIALGAFEHMRSQYLAKTLDDAKVLAVPTDVEDAEDREARLKGYRALGMNLLNVASFFVPLLGEVLMAQTVLEIAGEVYEGYQDWLIGDREGAINHVFNVAETVVVGAMIAAGSTIARRTFERITFVDQLAPIRTSSGEVKLMAAELAGYAAAPRSSPGAQEWLWHIDETRYRVVDDPHTGASTIQHPGRPDAYRPLLEHNGSGGWRHELEAPQHWTGRANLVRRLSASLAELPDATCEHLMQVTGFDEAQLRRLHVEHAGVPARLLDALELHQAHEANPDFSAPQLAQHVAQQQIRPNGMERVLQRDFPALSVRCTRELLKQCSGVQLDTLGNGPRIPLAVAERARWMLRDSRLDRACAGLRLPRCVNSDTERLALGILGRQPAWPDTLCIELREGSPSGRLLARAGAEGGAEVRIIRRHNDGYRYADQAVSAPYLGAVLAALDESMKVALGDAVVSPEALGTFLADVAAGNRAQAAELCGMARLGAGLRPATRLGDGRVGYPLSGRGAISRRAMGRGIHQVFPTLTDSELEAYLLDLMQRRVGLWEHYSQLRDQLSRLRESLRAWYHDARNPLDTMRRRRVATALRRSWRRKITDLAGDYVLIIEDERVGQLPDLPVGVRFDHVRRLVLRNLGLTELPLDFLQRFPNLVELDLSGNRLAVIPLGVEVMPRLRRLNLRSNRIVMDEAGEQRLVRIDSLQRLDLSHNPLGRAPVLARLGNLREVNLRAADLAALPEQLPLRAHVDLRDNNIRVLRREVDQLRWRVRQLSLHDNPLSEADEALLDEARGIAPGMRGSASARHRAVDDDLFATWAGSAMGMERERQQVTWSALREEPQSGGLFRFLGDFAHTDDFAEHPGHYRSRMWRILRACEEHEQLRDRLFLEASGPRTCEDRLLMVLEQLELGVMVERAVDDVGSSGVEARLLSLGRGLSRLDEVDRQASLHLQRLRAGQVGHVDDIEVRLYYRQRLARALGLPIEIDDMHYPTFANLTTSDLLRVQDLVLLQETPEALIEALAQRPFWQAYVREAYTHRFEEILQPLHQRMETLQAQMEAGEIDENEYLKRCEALKGDYETSEQGLTSRLTREAYERWGGAPR